MQKKYINIHNAKLTALNKEIQLPILNGTEGNPVIDISELYKHGLYTLDNGFMSTGSCVSSITYIDGQNGILRYRGYDIKDLAQNSSFMEVVYLLLHGELPTGQESESFISDIKLHSMVHEQIHFLYRGFPRFAHPMAIIAGSINSLSAFYHEKIDIQNPMDRRDVAIKLIAKLPTLAAMAYKYSIGQPFVHPNNSLDYASNFINMMFAIPSEQYIVNPVIAKALDLLLLLHADHEQNASTSTVRMAGSSGANPFAVMGAGIAALWGPAHGGANEAVLKMLREIGHIDRIPVYIDKAKDKNDQFKLMGFGHRIYKNYDPRASIIKEKCYDVLKELKILNDPLLEIALELEKIALNDEYFIERSLYPNVDFYSGIIYHAIGIPTQMFTVMFAMARIVGWVAQWKEMLESEDFKICRPRQLYIGEKLRKYEKNLS